ncbi:MAG: His/Gly/Thr/Pro-type tRNA ligase C-terminal domain-containing protein [Patescibacteria group bacterium]
MLRLKDTKHQNTASFLESAIGIAEYYGFKPLEDAPRRDSATLKHIREQASRNETPLSLTRKEERPLMVSGKRSALAARGQDESLLLWRTVNDLNSNIPHASLELHVVGTGASIAEALLIVVANSIVEEAGVGERVLSINDMGSGESSSRFVRDVANYLRKHIESISPTLRPRVAIDPLGTLIALIERGHPATPRAPQSMEYLTEDERRRFWELLEYMEVYGLPYELSPHVLGSRDFWAHTLYQISAVNPESGLRIPIAFGGRYDPLAARFAASPTSAAVISITCEMHGRPSTKPEATEIPSLYFAHLGQEAKRKSLPVFEKLRTAGIRIRHGLCFDRMGEQMSAARDLATPYILIMGHKEAMEGTIIVRETATNSQEIVSIPDLTNYLKRKKPFSAAYSA